MALNEITGLAEYGFFGLLIVLVGLIRIPTLEINFWAFLARAIGKAINAEVIEDVKKSRKEAKEDIANLRKDLDEHKSVLESLFNCYEAMMERVHNKAEFAINNIKRTYDKCLQEKDFLAYEEVKKFRTVKNNDNEGNNTIS